MTSRKWQTIARWPQPGVALLPTSLRRRFADEVLPPWVSRDLGLPVGAQVRDLGASVWDHGADGLTPRVRSFLVNFVSKRRGVIDDLQVWDVSWPPGLTPGRLPLDTRTRNCLEKAGLLEDGRRCARLTYGDLLRIHGLGIVSLLTFTATADTALRSLKEVTVHYETILRDLEPYAEESWGAQVSEKDPRFADVLPPGEGTVRERIEELRDAEEPMVAGALLNSMERVEERLREIDQMSLEDAARDFVAALTDFSGDKLEALLARLGWAGREPVTLKEAGEIVGLTRERIRQLQDRVMRRVPDHPIYMPALDRALASLAQHAPLSLEAAADYLAASEVTRGEFSPRGLLEFAEASNRPRTAFLEEFSGHERIVVTPHHEAAGTVISVAKRQAMASGASNILEVVAETEDKGTRIGSDEVVEILNDLSNVEFLDSEWFWCPEGVVHRNRLRNVSRKMLSVTSPLTLQAIREGVRRYIGYRGSRGTSEWPLLVPPRDILSAFYQRHPEFQVVDDGVQTTELIDYKSELSDTEQVLVEVIRSSPAGVLDRASFWEGCKARGVNENTFNVYTSYSPLIAHPGIDVWALRGTQVDPAAVEALRQASAARPREKRVLDHGWTAEGDLWIAARLPGTTRNFVMQMPAAVTGYVKEREFAAFTEGGSSCGMVQVNENGNSWGYSKFLRRAGADGGDILVVEVDLRDARVTLKLGNEELLDELE